MRYIDSFLQRWRRFIGRPSFKDLLDQADEEESKKEERAVPVKSVPPTETRDNLYALAFRRVEGRLEPVPQWISKDPTDAEYEQQADEYERYAGEEYLRVSAIAHFPTKNGDKNLLVHLTKPVGRSLSWQEHQDLGDYCLKLMAHEYGDILTVSLLEDGQLTVCALMTSCGDQPWTFYEARIDGFQYDNPLIFSSEHHRDKARGLPVMPVKVKRGSHAGYLSAEILVNAIKKGESFYERGFLPIKVAKKGVLVRVIVRRYRDAKRVTMAVYEPAIDLTQVYNDEGEARDYSKDGALVNEVSTDGLPYGEKIQMGLHFGRPVMRRMREVSLRRDKETPAPAHRLSTESYRDPPTEDSS